MKRLSIQIACTALLIFAAAGLAAYTAGTFTRAERPEPVSYDGAAAEYVLRDYRGYVSVFAPEAESAPLRITGILTSTLREQDRAMLQGGLTVGSREQLLMLLEDLSE